MWVAQFFLTEQNCPKVSAICHDCQGLSQLTMLLLGAVNSATKEIIGIWEIFD